jgi:hypothetical protein
VSSISRKVSSGVSYRGITSKASSQSRPLPMHICSSRTKKKVHFLWFLLFPVVEGTGPVEIQKTPPPNARFAQNADLNEMYKKCCRIFKIRRLHGDLLLSSLLRESFSRDCEHALEALAALGSILAESVHSDLLDAVLDFLPPAAHCDNLGRLVKDGLARCASGCVANSLLHRQKLAPCQVLRAHGNGLFARVDVGYFVDEAGIV